MKSLFILSLVLACAFTSTFKLEEQLIKDLFQQWKANHKKFYSTAFEEQQRFEIFTENYLSILEVNAAESDLTLALNEFGDLRNDEFKALYTGFFRGSSDKQADFAEIDASNLPASWDWRTKGAVTPIKNQGQCGSCWAFSATGALEGFNFINTGKLISFSEQNLVDCVTADKGCGGGLPTDAFTYTAQNGIETEADYPYTGANGKCAFQKNEAVQVNNGYLNVTVGNTTALKAAVVQQPVSVAVDANLLWQFYFGGVIKRWCGASLDHGVLVVGYDNIEGTDAFIVKNSWGSSWGNAGYIYVATDNTANGGLGVCGILSIPAIPTQSK